MDVNEELALAEEALQWIFSQRKGVARNTSSRILQKEIQRLKKTVSEMTQVKEVRNLNVNMRKSACNG